MSDSLERRLGYLAGRGRPAARPTAAGWSAPPGPGWEPIGRWTWRRAERVPGGLDAGVDLGLLGCARPPDELLFYDTETTGLSGGAGSLAFLVGLARPVAGGIELEQLFLADFPGESEFLQALSERLFALPVTLVSYNGKGFDSHLLRARFSLAGLEAPFAEQLDLLYPVRRFWRRVLPECSLTAVAEAVLGVRRSLDIPGAEVPDAYFEYLRRGDIGRLPLVFEHNRQDILAMVGLLSHMEALISGRAEPVRVDLSALGAGCSRAARSVERTSSCAGSPRGTCRRGGGWVCTTSAGVTGNERQRSGAHRRGGRSRFRCRAGEVRGASPSQARTRPCLAGFGLGGTCCGRAATTPRGAAGGCWPRWNEVAEVMDRWGRLYLAVGTALGLLMQPLAPGDPEQQLARHVTAVERLLERTQVGDSDSAAAEVGRYMERSGPPWRGSRSSCVDTTLPAALPPTGRSNIDSRR